jgi:hypothetical protein
VKNFYKIFPFVFLLHSAIGAISLNGEKGGNNWEYLFKKKGFYIFKKEIPDSDYVKFKGYGIIKAPMMHIMSVLNDVNQHKKWLTNCLESREIRRINDKESLIYYATQSPWPIKDRDFVLKAKAQVDEEKHWVHIRLKETIHATVPIRDDRVRMPFIRITWSFRPTHEGKHTLIIFKSHANPGGWVPSWAINFYGRYIALNSLIKLENRVLTSKLNEEFLKKYEEYSRWK